MNNTLKKMETNTMKTNAFFDADLATADPQIFSAIEENKYEKNPVHKKI